MMKVSVDFNNLARDGLLAASYREVGDLQIGQVVTVIDPGESEEFRATVAEVDPSARTVFFDVEWEPVSIPLAIKFSPQSLTFTVPFGTQTTNHSVLVNLSPRRFSPRRIAKPAPV